MRLRIAIALVVAAAIGAVAYVLLSDEAGDTSPRGHAIEACEAATKFDAAVRRNDDVDTVKGHLQNARDEARKAEQGNSLYVGLASGIEALHIAIETNDGQAAKVGVEVVRNECGYVRRSASAPAGS